jgi:hypothetical protein
MYQLEDIFCPQLYPRACNCLMMYCKNNWNAGPFFYFMDFLEEKNPYTCIFIYNFKSHFLHTQAFSDILKLSTQVVFQYFRFTAEKI